MTRRTSSRFVVTLIASIVLVVIVVIGIFNSTNFSLTGNIVDIHYTNTAKCNDTDGGIFVYDHGIVKLRTSPGITTERDHCTSEKDITELYCQNDQINYLRTSCQYECKEGVCVENYLTESNLIIDKIIYGL